MVKQKSAMRPLTLNPKLSPRAVIFNIINCLLLPSLTQKTGS